MLARTAHNAEQRAMLQNMALTWESLAQDRERRLAQAGRIAVLEQPSSDEPTN